MSTSSTDKLRDVVNDSSSFSKKEEAKKLKRKRIEENGGVRPRTTLKEMSSYKRKNKSTPIQSQLKTMHRFGAVMETVPCRNESRNYTLSIAIAGSVMSNCQTLELRTQLIGQIARAATIFHVDEIIVFDDKLSSKLNGRENFYRRSQRNRGVEHSSVKTVGKDDKTTDHENRRQEANKNVENDDNKHEGGRYLRSDAHTFMARILQYIECPQYLRRQFEMHPDLRCAGLLPPLHAPHHVRAGERSKYREGIVLDKRGSKPDSGSLVNCGIRDMPVEIDKILSPGIRCTVKIGVEAYGKPGRIKGTVVSPNTPREDDGTYWGYRTRTVDSIKGVFDNCPFSPSGYDLKIGTSERGDTTVDNHSFGLRSFKHLLIVFGGVAGIEECIDADESLKLSGDESRKLFDVWLNICPYQGSRTIRTEEAILIGLSRLSPYTSGNTPEAVTSDCSDKNKKLFETTDIQISDEEISDESSGDET